MTPTRSDWQIRRHVYEALSSGHRAPNAADLAEHFHMSTLAIGQALRRLHNAHALVLRQGSSDILMANPLSAIPTDYRVLIGKRTLYANCAWDSLGIPAMLGADASIQARHPLSGEIINYRVEAGRLGGCCQAIVHFALPFRKWYDDIVDT